MSEQDSDAAESPADEKIPRPERSGTERAFVRMTFWQTVLSLVGVFIAVVALYAALKESAAVRQQTAAAVWPFVQLSIEDYDDGEAARFAMSFTNVGVGPAKMKSLNLTLDGRPARNWQEALARVGGDESAGVSRNFVQDRVFSPGERVDMIRTHDAGLARRFQAAIAQPDNYITYCYCSIFDECWQVDSRGNVNEPEPVQECPDYGEAAYGN